MTFSNFAQVQASIFRTASHKYPQQNQVPIEKAFDNGCECSQVLIVDDIDMNRIFLSEILKRNFNIKSDQAIDGLECLKTVKEKQFNECCSYYQLIFMDFEMPIMNGMEASRKIAGYKIKGKIDVRTVIIGYTAYTDEENNCLSNGMEFFLPKPASCAQIKACLEEVKRKQHENQNKVSPKSNRKRKITNQASVIMNIGSDNVVTPHLFNPNIISSDLKAPTLNSVAHNSAAFENIIQIQPPQRRQGVVMNNIDQQQFQERNLVQYCSIFFGSKYFYQSIIFFLQKILYHQNSSNITYHHYKLHLKRVKLIIIKQEGRDSKLIFRYLWKQVFLFKTQNFRIDAGIKSNKWIND